MSRPFTYPFAYTPSAEVRDAADELISRIDADPRLSSVFRDGKMMGVLITDKGPLYAFSGLAGGKSDIGGFVPPIFDTTRIPELRGVNSPDGSAALQDRLFELYIVHNALGEELSVKGIFARRGLVPPGGTGECAAPKLLEFAYRNSLTPIAMGEFWYGASPASGEVREHGRFYPSCTGKCGPLLTWMMRGLEVEDNPLAVKVPFEEIKLIYEDDDILVVNKPSGMLCAPGLTGEKSLPELLEPEYGTLLGCHRLDMDTSGVMVFARNLRSQKEIQRQFTDRRVQKTYLAHLCAGPRPWKGPKTGTIALPLVADFYDRPRQSVDLENGRQAITRFEILSIFADGEMDVRFYPLTGRTHQLRVHAASPMGLGRPIKGDRLYGDPSGGRLRLHAESICFTHPSSGERVTFSSPVGSGL